MKDIIRILLVEDHLIARIGISAIIGMQPEMIVIGEAVNGLQGIEMYRKHQPDLVLMDLQMAEMNGIEALQKIRGEFPNSRIIILSSHSGDAEITRALSLGAFGYVLKDVLEDELIKAVRIVHQGKKFVSANVAQILSEFVGSEKLTPSEENIVRLIVEGLTTTLIAERLFISENTVKSHLKNIFGKLAVNDRSQLVSVAIKRGLVTLDK